MPWLIVLIGLIALVAVAFVFVNLRRQRRISAIQQLLDDADRLEAKLHETRQRMRELESLLGRLPADITEQARASLASEAGIQDALKKVLGHRLWIRENAETAPIQALRDVGDSVRKSLTQLETQLARLDLVGTDLKSAYAHSDALIGAPAATEPPAP